MIDESIIRTVADRLLAAAPAGSKVILFGSYARGQADSRSDLDFLVVEPQVPNRLAEMVRLREAVEPVVAPLRIGVDVLVTSAATFDYWRDTPNTVYYRVVKEGKAHEPVG